MGDNHPCGLNTTQPMLSWTKWLRFDCMWAIASYTLEIVMLVSILCVAKMRAAADQTKPQDKNQLFAAKFCCMLEPYSIILN
jgi:heme/copper-type cytochrome/quinol oxidase subunit 2